MFYFYSKRRYHSSQSGNWEQQGNTDLAERLRREFNTALSNAGSSGSYRTSASYSSGNVGNGIACTTECKLLPGHSNFNSQADLDAIARDMTSQIVNDLQTGKLHRSQIDSQNWFENRVAEKLSDLHQQHQTEFQRNLESVASRFHHNSLQQQQQQQQSLFSQSQQQQQQGSHFQQQSQVQNFGYVQPIVSGNTYQKVIEERHNVNSNAAYPTPVTVFHGATVLQNNCTDNIHSGILPYFNVQNKFNQHSESNRQTNAGTTYIRPITGGSNYHVTTHIERKEHRVPQIPIVIPSQNSYSHQIEEERREVHRQQPRPQIYNINQRNHTEHVEQSKIQVFTPAPVLINNRQDIYDHFRESEYVPNYRPRVVIDKNTKFHELEVRNRHHEYQPVVIPAPVTTTHVKEEERIDRQFQQRPIVLPTPMTTTHIKEEEQIDRQFQQKPIVIPAPVTTTHVKEEEKFDRQYQQRPIYRPQSTVTTHTEEQHTSHQSKRPQLPIFSHTTNVQSYNESSSSNQQTQTIHHRPGGQTITTVKEEHYVKILPQPATHYTIQYTEREYLERLNRIQQELRRLGYGTLTEEEYNATISSGGFIHNGYKYLYNADRGRYEKAERVDISEEEYHSLLRRLQNQLQQYGLSQMSESEFNQTIHDGFFQQNGIRYIYDSETGTYRREEISHERYEVLRQRLQDEFNQRGWGILSEREFNQTLATGYLVINGHRYVVDKYTGEIQQGEEIQINEQEYRTILRRLQDQLRWLGFDQMTEREYNQTIRSGYFVRGGQKYRYNADIGRYEKVEVTTEEYVVIVNKLKETLQRLNYRQMNEQECNETIASGTFIRGGYQWSYNTETGEANAIRIAAPFEELSETEYLSIYRRLQNLLRGMGYPQMSEIEVNTTITSGTFSRGGNQWVYQPYSGEFNRIELSENEYNYRVNRLIEILNQLGVKKSREEYRDIINRGCFYHGGQRYEYDSASGAFILSQMTESEYRERVRQLLDQLQRIGYGTMTESECRATINSGVFYYGGHEWVYDYRSHQYEMGRATNRENGIVDDNYFNNINYDRTNYTSSKTDNDDKQNAFDIDKNNGHNGRQKEIISKNRGDQPPQTFEEDYEESIEVEKEPDIHYTRKPTLPPTTPRPVPRYVVTVGPYTEEQHQRIETQKQETVYVPVPVPEQFEEQRYHHKKTTYTQTSGYVSNAKRFF